MKPGYSIENTVPSQYHTVISVYNYNALNEVVQVGQVEIIESSNLVAFFRIKLKK